MSDPPVGVSASAISRTLVCQPGVSPRHGEPVLLLGAAGNHGRDLWTWGWQRALLRAGHPSCYLDLPQDATGDMQVSARHVVLAVRAMHARVHGPVAIYGLGAGALVARLALTGWPDERRLVSDVISVSGIHHGSWLALASCNESCPALIWQRRPVSLLLAALGRFADETPGPTAWTTVRSLDDFAAEQYGPHPTGALNGATNLLLQKVCPGRYRDSVTLAFDSLAFALMRDALAHPGPALLGRLKRPCARQYAPGLARTTVQGRLSMAFNLSARRILGAPFLDAEPPVLAPFAVTNE